MSRPELAMVSIDSLLSQDTNGLERVRVHILPAGHDQPRSERPPSILLHGQDSHLVTWSANGRFLALLSKDLDARTPVFDRWSGSDSWLQSLALVSFPTASSDPLPAKVNAERSQFHLRGQAGAWSLYVPQDMHQVLATNGRHLRHAADPKGIACGISLEKGHAMYTHCSRWFQLEDVQDGTWAEWTSQRTSTVFELCSEQKVAAPRKIRQALSIAWVPARPRCTPTYARLLKSQPAAAWDGVVNLCLVDGVDHYIYSRASLLDLEQLSRQFSKGSDLNCIPLSKLLSVHWSPNGGTLVAECANGLYVLAFAPQHV